MRILVGCPISSDRDWVIREYRAYLEAAADVADVEIDVLFLAYREDDPQWLRDAYPSAHIEFTDLHSSPGDHHWSQERYHHMAALRNELLTYVRDREPEIFFSLDSDILLHPLAIKSALGIFNEQPKYQFSNLSAAAKKMKGYHLPGFIIFISLRLGFLV